MYIVAVDLIFIIALLIITNILFSGGFLLRFSIDFYKNLVSNLIT